MLLASKADVNAKANDDGRTPLHMAVLQGDKEVVQVLLASKAEVNAKDNDGVTPLHVAVAKGHKTLVELLRQHGGHE